MAARTPKREPELVDVPSFGKVAAEVGTVEWAERLRLDMGGMVKDLSFWAKQFKGCVDLAIQNRAWTMLKDPVGQPYRAWEAFCAERQPWGLGRPWPEIKPAMEAALIEAGQDAGRTLQLVTVAPAQNPADKPRVEHGHFSQTAPGAVASQTAPGAVASKRQAEAVRAIAERAPEPARELYKAGLLGQKEAAKLGPKNPTPEQAAKVTEVALAAADVAKAEPKPKTEPERKRLQRKINAVVREALGVEDNQVAKLLRTIARLPDDDRGRLFDCLRAAHPEAFS
jgi:hypothetical protein